jgi:hypothetical protein
VVTRDPPNMRLSLNVRNNILYIHIVIKYSFRLIVSVMLFSPVEAGSFRINT